MTDALVKFSALCPAAVIFTQLITSIDTTHHSVLIVWIQDRMGVREWSFCRRRTEPITDSCVLLAFAITTFLSIQAYAATPPFWTTSESPLFGELRIHVPLDFSKVNVPVGYSLTACCTYLTVIWLAFHTK